MVTLGEKIGDLSVKVTDATYLEVTKKHDEPESFIQVEVFPSKVLTSVAYGWKPQWNDRFTLPVRDYTFVLKLILFELEMITDKHKKRGVSEIPLNAEVLSDGQLLNVQIRNKKVPIANVKLFVQFIPHTHPYGPLQRLILEDTSMLAAIFDTCQEAKPIPPLNEVTHCIYTIFSNNDKLLDLMKHIITYEVARIDSIALMVRDETPTVQLLSEYVNNFGRTFLKKIIKFVLPIIFNDSGHIELDPVKMGPNENLATNQRHFYEKAQAVFDALFALHPYIHPNLREVCRIIIRVVSKRFPDDAYIGLGSIIFLRYICPAIACPETLGFTEEISPKMRRSLILITKLLQSLSNNVQFGEKESYMLCMNQFLENNHKNIFTFYHNILNERAIDKVANEESAAKQKIPIKIFHKLHSYFFHNSKLLCSKLDTYPLKDDQKKFTSAIFESIMEDLPHSQNPYIDQTFKSSPLTTSHSFDSILIPKPGKLSSCDEVDVSENDLTDSSDIQTLSSTPN